jgi:ferredoxin
MLAGTPLHGIRRRPSAAVRRSILVPNLRIVVDRRKCAGEAICVGIAPEVFDLDDEQIAIVINPEGADHDTIMEAAQACPQDAISVIDVDTGERLAA